jgi:hypothetical protein
LLAVPFDDRPQGLDVITGVVAQDLAGALDIRLVAVRGADLVEGVRQCLLRLVEQPQVQRQVHLRPPSAPARRPP